MRKTRCLVGYTNAEFYIPKAEEYSEALDDWKVEWVNFDESLKEQDNGLALGDYDEYLKPEEWITYNRESL
jgi:hypothetical protein